METMITTVEPAFGVVMTRRAFVARTTIALSALVSTPSRSGDGVGSAVAIRGGVTRERQTQLETLVVGSDVMIEDRIRTGANGFADLKLSGKTHILLGSETEFLIDSFIASEGGTMELGTGRMVFNRPEGLPKFNLAVRTAFGLIGVRGTKFFCGPNRGVFAVFVEHGQVAVAAGGKEQLVGPGEGVEIAGPGARPSNFAVWAKARVDEAYASVGPAQ